MPAAAIIASLLILSMLTANAAPRVSAVLTRSRALSSIPAPSFLCPCPSAGRPTSCARAAAPAAALGPATPISTSSSAWTVATELAYCVMSGRDRSDDRCRSSDEACRSRGSKRCHAWRWCRRGSGHSSQSSGAVGCATAHA
eukprot:6877571-Pyramimonas_sp.AAC.3